MKLGEIGLDLIAGNGPNWTVEQDYYPLWPWGCTTGRLLSNLACAALPKPHDSMKKKFAEAAAQHKSKHGNQDHNIAAPTIEAGNYLRVGADAAQAYISKILLKSSIWTGQAGPAAAVRAAYGGAQLAEQILEWLK